MIVFSCSVSFVYIINQLADIEADKKNGGLPLIASGIVSLKAAKITAWCAAIVSLAVPLLFLQIRHRFTFLILNGYRCGI